MLTFLLTLAAEAPAIPEPSSELKGFPLGVSSLIGLLLLGLAVSFGVGKLVVVLLKNRRFDDLFVPPWKPAFDKRGTDRWSASGIVGWACSLTSMVILIWGFAQYHGISHPTLDQMLSLCGQAWMLLLTILVALGIARVVAAAVISIFKNQAVRRQLELFCPHVQEGEASLQKNSYDVVAAADDDDDDDAQDELLDLDEPEQAISGIQQTIAQFAEEPLETSETQPEQQQEIKDSVTAKPEKTEAFADTLARLVGLLIYLIVFLPVFMVAAEIWSWSDTSNAISNIWGWLIPLVGLAAIILLGWFALTAAVIAVIPVSQRRSVMIGTTLLAMVILVASYNTLFALIFSVAVIIFAWITRNDLPDALAGWYLKSQSNLSAKTPLGPGKIVRVQLLTSDLKTVNGSFRVRNRHVLRCYLDGTMIAELRMIPIDETGNPVGAKTEGADELQITS